MLAAAAVVLALAGGDRRADAAQTDDYSNRTSWKVIDGECRDSLSRQFRYFAPANVTDSTGCRRACEDVDACGSFTLATQGGFVCLLNTDAGVWPSVNQTPAAGWGAEVTNDTAAGGLHPVSRNETVAGAVAGMQCFARAFDTADFADPTSFPTWSPLQPTSQPTLAPTNSTQSPLVPTVPPSRAPSAPPTTPSRAPTIPPSHAPTVSPPGQYQAYAFWYGRCESVYLRSFYIRQKPCHLYSFGMECNSHLFNADALYAEFFGGLPCAPHPDRRGDPLYEGNDSCRTPRDMRWSRRCYNTAEEARRWLDGMVRPDTGGWFVQESYRGDGSMREPEAAAAAGAQARLWVAAAAACLLRMVV
eukprot:TRINITY_DN14939_c0_g1_i1.p1 TRINITY_DN14939_c0_g1~~TRINITY_DN14939_c0_g1_i1.p1  ORF type:complete len:360 (+),score=93.47 TRINITY_DN14939_c0_g1_i1:93-1172(+)